MQIKFSAEPTGDAVAYLAYEGDKGVEFAADLDKAVETAIRRAIRLARSRAGPDRSSKSWRRSFPMRPVCWSSAWARNRL